MACADVILPAATHLEYGDLYKAYGHHYLQRSAPVIEPVGEALPNTEIFRRLAARFGFDEPCFIDSDQALMDQALAADAAPMRGRRASQLAPGEAVDMSVDNPASVLRGQQPATPSGKIELFSETLEQTSGTGLPRYRELLEQRRFLLVSPASERRINSTFGGLHGHADDLVCEMSPADAELMSLSTGRQVKLFNDQGEVELPLVITDRVRPGTVYVPKGAWLRNSPTGQTINALIPGHKSDLHDGACYYDCSVDIAPL
jgi:anaerobic selenocysteine-containing dehydrogenase